MNSDLGYAPSNSSCDRQNLSKGVPYPALRFELSTYITISRHNHYIKEFSGILDWS